MPSAIKSVSQGPGIPVSTPPQAYTDLLSDSDDKMEDEDISVTYQPLVESIQPKPFSQAELNYLTRDLGLSKESIQLFGSRSSGTAAVTKSFQNILV